MLCKAGFAWVRFNYDPLRSPQRVSFEDFVEENFGDVLTANYRSTERGELLLPPDIYRQSSQCAELFAMLDLLMHIHKSPNLHHKPVLIRYDSETSRRVITGQWHIRDINLVPLVSVYNPERPK